MHLRASTRHLQKFNRHGQYVNQNMIRHQNTAFSNKPQHSLPALFSQPAGHGPVYTDENHVVITSRAKAGVSPNHISKRLASNNRLITVAGVEPLSPLPSRSLTLSKYNFSTKRTIKNKPINTLFICTKIYSIFLDTIRLPCALLTMPRVTRCVIFFVYLGFYVAFNTVQVISRWVVGRAEETSTYSSLGFCIVNCRPTASNYQLSHTRCLKFYFYNLRHCEH